MQDKIIESQGSCLLAAPRTTTMEIPADVVDIVDVLVRLESGASDLAKAWTYLLRQREAVLREMLYRVADPAERAAILRDTTRIDEQVSRVAGPEAVEAPVGIAEELAELRGRLTAMKPALDLVLAPFARWLNERLVSSTGHELREAGLVREWLLGIAARIRIQIAHAPETIVLRDRVRREVAA